MTNPNKQPASNNESVITDGWMTGPRPDILDPTQQMVRRFPGLNPDAMRKGPTEGHISVTSSRPEVDRDIVSSDDASIETTLPATK